MAAPAPTPGPHPSIPAQAPLAATDPTPAAGPAAAAGPEATSGQLPVHPYPGIDLAVGHPISGDEESADRRAVQVRQWWVTAGVPGPTRRGYRGPVRRAPSRRQRDGRLALSAVRRGFGGLRQVTVANPAAGAGKTIATLMLGLTFGQLRGGFVLAWDNSGIDGLLGLPLGVRARPDAHDRTVQDLLRDLHRFDGGSGRIGELSGYLRSQDGAMFDVLASDLAGAGGEPLTAPAFRAIREVAGRFYKLILVDTGNDMLAENWQAALDATDQLVITLSAGDDAAETAAGLLDHLSATDRRELTRRSVVVMTMPPHGRRMRLRAIERHFAATCRAVLRVPYDRHLDTAAPVSYRALSAHTRRAWLLVAAAVAEGL